MRRQPEPTRFRAPPQPPPAAEGIRSGGAAVDELDADLVFTARRGLPPAVRVLIDELVARFAEEPAPSAPPA